MLYGRLFGSIQYCLFSVKHLNFSSGKKKKTSEEKLTLVDKVSSL